MYILRVKVRIQNEKLNEFEQSMNNLMKGQKIHSGVLASLYRSANEKNVFFYQEEWRSKKNLDKHIDTEHFRALLGCIKSLGEVEQSEIIHSASREKLV